MNTLAFVLFGAFAFLSFGPALHTKPFWLGKRLCCIQFVPIFEATGLSWFMQASCSTLFRTEFKEDGLNKEIRAILRMYTLLGCSLIVTHLKVRTMDTTNE